MPSLIRVYFEQGKTWTFACALDWPGWCRRGKGEPAALEALLDYGERYALVVGPDFVPGEVHIVGRVPGNATTDFGAPDATGEWDDEPLDPAEASRLAGLLAASWRALDRGIERAPVELRKGPRGGGRDRDAVANHVQEAERSYGRKIGVRLPPRTPWMEQRQAFHDALAAGAPDGSWSARYACRRFAWHVLDHAWEIEDRSHPGR